jgi:hypothetical protein
LPRYAKRTDRNHAEIRDGLRSLGYDVFDLSDVGGGVPDLVVNRTDFQLPPIFLEIKDSKQPPSKRRLTAAESNWVRYCGEITHTVTTIEEAVQVIKSIDQPNQNSTIPTGALPDPSPSIPPKKGRSHPIKV